MINDSNHWLSIFCITNKQQVIQNKPFKLLEPILILDKSCTNGMKLQSPMPVLLLGLQQMIKEQFHQKYYVDII